MSALDVVVDVFATGCILFTGYTLGTRHRKRRSAAAAPDEVNEARPCTCTWSGACDIHGPSTPDEVNEAET